MTGGSAPRATYRVQLTPDFGFDATARLVDYLAELGVSHLYTSPYLQAAPGSTHGYDVVDHSRVNQELGGATAHGRMVVALREAGLGHVIDLVPNHMAIGSPDNRWWWDVLENGPAGMYSTYFDVDWKPPEAKLRNKVLMAILGDHYGRVLEAGELRVERSGGSFTVRYYDHRLPAAPRSLEPILKEASATGPSLELESLAAAYGRLPRADELDEQRRYERHRDNQVLRDRLEDVLAADGDLSRAVDDVLERISGDPDAMDEFLERQNYRLAYWRTAAQELDYRRFFDVDTLVALRVENEQVFSDTHELILGWVNDGVVDGLRIDHPDGLRDPEGYLRRLAARTGDAWVVVEKILEPGEQLPVQWPVAGTTGYDFLNRLTGVFVDPAGEDPLTEIYARLTGESTDYPALVVERKLQVMNQVLAADVNRLTGVFAQVCENNRRYRDFTRRDLDRTLRAVLSAFPVYRTYARSSGSTRPDDAEYVTRACREAAERRPDLDGELFRFLEDLLLRRIHAQGPSDSPENELVMRFQQLSGPVMAKGVEDTAFYNFNRFVVLNEVGGDPGRFGTSPEEFHAAAMETRQRWPETMVTTSTHDTKRSEDVRARLVLLSEIPEAWGEAVQRWMTMNERFRSGGVVDRNAEYLLYQNLVGAWPVSPERAAAYAEKATREAKTHTSWVNPTEEYDRALRRFVEGVLGDSGFTSDLEAFVAPLVAPGRLNSLSQTLVKLTAPGVPDIYQGTELWDLSLVDPDNRRPVDFETRRRLLQELAGLKPDAVLARWEEGLPKLLVTQRALQLRQRRAEAFGTDGDYVALGGAGSRAGHLLGFMRGGSVITLVPRLVLGLGEWGDTTIDLPHGEWRSVFTDEVTAGGPALLSALLSDFPVALLERG